MMSTQTSEAKVNEAITAELFQERLGAAIDRTADSLHFKATLIADLGFDSLDVLETWAFLDDLCEPTGIVVESWRDCTVGELYDLYVTETTKHMRANASASDR
jgi:acyl carrier protein